MTVVASLMDVAIYRESTSGDGSSLFGAAGLLNVVMGGGMLIRAWRRRARWVRVDGEIVGYSDYRGSEATGLSRAVFRFTTLEGLEMQVESKLAKGGRSFQRGDRITAMYNPKKPEDAVITTPVENGTALGGFFAIVGVVLITMSALDGT